MEQVAVISHGSVNIQAVRQSNQILLVPKRCVPDSDSVTLEDKSGYRYFRDITNEGLEEKTKCYYLFRQF